MTAAPQVRPCPGAAGRPCPAARTIPHTMTRCGACWEAETAPPRRPVALVADAPGAPPPLTIEEVAGVQTERAIEDLYADPARCVEFPYAGVDAMVGRIAPGRLVFLMANTGQGKTTFCLDVFDRWTEAGVRIDYLGTEQAPEELRTKWACLRVGVPAGIAIGKEWDKYPAGYGAYPTGEAMRDAVHAELDALACGDLVGRSHFSPEKFITVPRIERAAADAAARGATVLFIDHIDRVDVGGDESSEYRALKRTVQRCTELARDHGLVIVAVSQLNRQARQGHRLAAYQPPQAHHMRGGGMKEEEAHAILGLWRPISQSATKPELAAAKAGAAKPATVLEPNTMAVVLLKHRTWGGREGERCKLAVAHGRLSDQEARHAYQTASYVPRVPPVPPAPEAPRA